MVDACHARASPLVRLPPPRHHYHLGLILLRSVLFSVSHPASVSAPVVVAVVDPPAAAPGAGS
jgi:hypothetical protein